MRSSNSPSGDQVSGETSLSTIPPSELRQKGIHSASDNIGTGQRLSCAGAIWRWYGKALTERFTRQGGA